MRKKWIFLAGLLVCLLVAGMLYYKYKQPRAGVTSATASFTITATELYTDFNLDEGAANKKYNGKVVTVKGEVMEVVNEGERLMIVLKANNENGGVSCSFSDRLPAQLPSPGEEVTIKGRCTGFLMDVNLVDAVLIQ